METIKRSVAGLYDKLSISTHTTSISEALRVRAARTALKVAEFCFAAAQSLVKGLSVAMTVPRDAIASLFDGSVPLKQRLRHVGTFAAGASVVLILAAAPANAVYQLAMYSGNMDHSEPLTPAVITEIISIAPPRMSAEPHESHTVEIMPQESTPVAAEHRQTTVSSAYGMYIEIAQFESDDLIDSQNDFPDIEDTREVAAATRPFVDASSAQTIQDEPPNAPASQEQPSPEPMAITPVQYSNEAEPESSIDEIIEEPETSDADQFDSEHFWDDTYDLNEGPGIVFELAEDMEPPPPVLSNGFYIWPAEGNLSSRFGRRITSVGSTNHQGIDISGSFGQPIFAADGGEVITSAWSRSYGNYIRIRHDNGHITLYAHCSSLLVKTGDIVSQGQEIARMGRTGIANGVHLHFELMIDGRNVNPLPHLP